MTACTRLPASILAADLYVQDYAHRDVLDAATFRLGCVYGPRQPDPVRGWLTPIVHTAVHDEPVSIIDEGKHVRDVLYVTDLVRAVDAYLADPVDTAAIFNVGGGLPNAVSQLELLELTEDELGTRPSVEHVEAGAGDPRIYISDTKRAENQLDWESEIDVRSGFEHLREWYADGA